MYRIGYIDDQPNQYEIYRKKLQRRFKDVELILLDGCNTKEDFLEKIYEQQIEVLLVDYKMAGTFGFNGSTLISYINDQMRDLECFILTAVEQENIKDGLVASRDRRSKTIFDTEGDDEQRVNELNEFVEILKDSATVFRKRREEKKEKYLKLLEMRKSGQLSLQDEEEYLRLYKVLSSYGMIEKLPESILTSKFDEDLKGLLELGEAILKKYKE
ncbi:MAG: hypothetical protein IKK03_04070 [Lachnospiraceae bacterium]|nr:hypothetical protein [Lachnospiraceae bacterium]